MSRARTKRWQALVVAVLTAGGCGKPPVTPVPITAPWSAMGLPINSNAIVWGSTPSEFKVLHQGRIEDVARAYRDYFENNGWTVVNRDRMESSYHYAYIKAGEKVDLEVYLFKDVGVIIQRSDLPPQVAAALGQSPRPGAPNSTPANPSPAPQSPPQPAINDAPATPSPPAAGERYLRDLKPTSVVALPEGREHKFDRTFEVQGVPFEHGVYFCPPTPNSTGKAVFALGGAYTRLKGGAAISDHRFRKAWSPVTFRVVGDGRVLWTSKPIELCGDWQPFDIDLTGVDQLTLEVSCPSAHTGAHGSWMDPVLVRAP